MNREEFLQLAKGMRAAFQKEKFLADNASMEIWYRHLEDIPYEAASAAVHRYIDSNKFSPSIADIREMSVSVVSKEEHDSGEAWNKALNAVHRYGYVDQEGLLDSLDPLTREAARRFGVKDLCDIREESKAAARGQFMKIYDQVANRKKAEAVMSSQTRTAIDALRKKALEQMDKNLLEEKDD